MRRLIPLLSMVVLLVGCVHCGFGSYPNVRVEYDRVANVNSYADIAIAADQEVEIRFSTYGGRIVHRHNDRVIWQAPNEPGSYYVDALVISPSRSELDRMRIKVVDFVVGVVGAELLDDGAGGKNVRLQVFNTAGKKVTDFRVKLLLTNGDGERVAYLGDYQLTREVSEANLAPRDKQSYVLSLQGISGVANVYAWVYEATFEDGTVLNLYEQ
ncbi:MAG TPA: hypothetical protein GX014_06220 [Firmicutes bacterium]|jgi:hypothetical protein|nr:hypothetical protein [Bacillota bacterium]